MKKLIIIKAIVCMLSLAMILIYITNYSVNMPQIYNNSIEITPNEAFADFTTKCYAPVTITGPKWPTCSTNCEYKRMQNPIQVGICTVINE